MSSPPHTMAKTRGKFPPGPNSGAGKKLSGQLGPMTRDPLGFFTHCAHTYGDITGMRYYTFRVCFINHPDLIEDVLVTNARKFHKSRVLRANKIIFGEGL